MKWIRRLHGAFWWALASLQHVPHFGPLRLRAWVCRHYNDDTDAWFWSPPWQWGEWRTNRDIKAGRVESFVSAEEFLASLEPAEQPTGDGSTKEANDAR